MSALAFAVLTSFSSYALAGDYETLKYTDSSQTLTTIADETTNVTATDKISLGTDDRVIAIYQEDKTVSLTGNTINITTPALQFEGTDVTSTGIYQTGSTSVMHVGHSTSTVAINATSAKNSYGIFTTNEASAVIDGSSIVIRAESTGDAAVRGVQASEGGKLTLGSEETKLIDINVAGDENSIGLTALRTDKTKPGSSIVITADEFRLTTNGTFGIHVQNGSQDTTAPENTSSIIINAGKTTITNTLDGGLGISAFSNGYMEINGDLTVNAGHAIDVRGNSTILINKDKTGIVTLKGDIVFETPNQQPAGDSNNSGDKINANVTVNLSEGSSWTGRAYQSYPVKIDGQWVENKTVALVDNRSDYYGFVKGFSVNIDNGGVWNMTGDSFVNNASVNGGVINVYADAKTVNAAALDLNGGIVNMQGSADQKLNVVTLTGTGGTVNVATTANEDGTFTTPMLHVETVESAADVPTTLAMHYAGITADDLSADAAADLEKIAAQSLSLGEGESVAQIRTVDEGNVRGAVIQNVNEAGEVTDTNVAANTKLTNFSSVNAMSHQAHEFQFGQRHEPRAVAQ